MRSGRSFVFKYAGILEMDQKVIEGGIWHVKAYAWDFEMAQLRVGSESRSRIKTTNAFSFRILSHLRVLGLKKWVIKSIIEHQSSFKIRFSNWLSKFFEKIKTRISRCITTWWSQWVILLWINGWSIVLSCSCSKYFIRISNWILLIWIVWKQKAWNVNIGDVQH